MVTEEEIRRARREAKIARGKRRQLRREAKIARAELAKKGLTDDEQAVLDESFEHLFGAQIAEAYKRIDERADELQAYGDDLDRQLAAAKAAGDRRRVKDIKAERRRLIAYIKASRGNL